MEPGIAAIIGGAVGIVLVVVFAIFTNPYGQDR